MGMGMIHLRQVGNKPKNHLKNCQFWEAKVREDFQEEHKVTLVTQILCITSLLSQGLVLASNPRTPAFASWLLG